MLRLFAPTASTLYVNPDGVCGGNSPCFTTIQAAINAASPGDTIQVGAATYAENVDVNKALTVLGPNANINPNTGVRVAEAVIVPATSDPLNPSFAGPITVYLSAPGSTFKGFTVDGNNPSLTSGVVFNGQDVDAEFGIYGDGAGNLDAVVENNIAKNIGEMGIWLNTFGFGGARNNNSRINANKVDNILGVFGQALRISDDAWLDVTNNVVTRSRLGVVIENYSGNVTTHPASQIANNDITTFRIGIRHNLHYVYANPGFTITRNNVTAYAQSPLPPQVGASPVSYQGIRVESIQQTVAVDVIDNNVNANRAALQPAGYTRVDGVNVTNGSGTSPNMRFRLNNITGGIRGVFHETPAVPTFTCNNIVGNLSGIVVDVNANAPNGLVANNNNIVGNTTIGVQNNNGVSNVNAQMNWWGAANGPGPVGPGSGDKVSTNVDFSNWLTNESNCPPPCPTNVALASYGATATASSTVNANFPASGAINGEHNGNDWGAGGGWNDGTRNAFPDNIEINLNVTQLVDAIDVYTLKNSPNNGSTVGDFTSASSYGIKDFTVEYWNGSSWVTAATYTGNTRVKRRVSFSTPVSTSKVRVVVSSSGDGNYSRVVEIEVFSCAPVVVPTPTPTPTPSPTPTPEPTPCTNPSNNVARASNGSTAAASSTVNANFPAAGAIDGEHNGNNWGSGGGWNDGTRGLFPDNIQVNFNTNQTLREIDVYTLKNDFNSGSTVTDTTLATSYGIKDFDVQYWTGSAWATVPGGSVTNNTLAKRKFIFPDITTDRVRVVVNSSRDGIYSRVIEIEAFACAPVPVLCVNPGGTGGCFATIQAAINAANPGDQVIVYPGTYDEDVNVNKAGLKLNSTAGAGSTNIRGPIGGPGTTVQITASNVTVGGFTVTRLGNNTTDWNDPNLNTAGFAIQGQAITNALIRDNVITGNRTGIDINNSNGHTVRNNVIDFNRTGMIYRNQTDFQTVVENFITNNWTVGVLFLDGSGGTNSPVQSALHSTFSNNNMSANWYGQIVDRQSGGSLPAPATTNYKNFRGNWYGTTSPVVTTANSAEPGYAAQIPVAYGGTATPPGGQPDIAGPASANFQYTPFLLSGTDTNVETTPGRGTNGFQGVPNTVVVSPGNQNGWVFFDDNPGTGTGSGGFEAGPATPPLGTGSAFLTVDSQGRFAVGVFNYNGTRMDDLLSLVYGSYQDNNSNTVVAPSLQFDIDYDLNDAATLYQGRLVFEPYLSPTQGAVQQNVWQNWDPRNGNWYGTRTTVTVNNVAGVAQPCQPATPCTWTQVLALFPNAGVRNAAGSAVLFKVGGPWAPGFDGNVDNFVLRQNGAVITYNFENVP